MRDLQETMTARVGVLRTAAGLDEAGRLLDKLAGVPATEADLESWQVTNLLTVASALADAALLRRETRGSHWREDFPERDDAGFAGHLDAVMPVSAGGVATVSFTPSPPTDGDLS
jgi:L-aspartate oxidase